MNPLLMPVVAAQAMWVRARTEKVPPAGGPANGTAPASADDSTVVREPVRIGILGESTAAGCGVETHDQGFPGALARTLAERTGRPVEWSVIGQNAATARRIRYKLLPQMAKQLDVAVLLAGVNDVLLRRTPQDWDDDLAAILDELGARAERTVVTGIPPFDVFPGMPGVLGRYLAERAADLDKVSRLACATRLAASWVDANALLPVGPEFFSRDRFHPSEFGYRRWAGAVADHIEW